MFVAPTPNSLQTFTRKSACSWGEACMPPPEPQPTSCSWTAVERRTPMVDSRKNSRKMHETPSRTPAPAKEEKMHEVRVKIEINKIATNVCGKRNCKARKHHPSMNANPCGPSTTFESMMIMPFANPLA